MNIKSVQYTCRKCMCGYNMRQVECKGRMTKSEKKKILRKEGEKV